MSTLTVPENATTAEVVRWIFGRLNDHDLSALEQFWTADTVERFPDRTCRGPEEIRRYFEGTFAAFPDFHMEIVALAHEGENVFVRWQLTGTHRGPLQGIEPTGKQVTIDGMDHFVFADRKLVSNFVVFDQMQHARQLGMMPPEDSTADKALKGVFNARTKFVRRRNG